VDEGKGAGEVSQEHPISTTVSTGRRFGG
jgi:hypothetical protein